MESTSEVPQDAWAEYLEKFRLAESAGDFAQAKKMLDAALWKAEQFSLSTGRLIDTLESSGDFYAKRFMDVQAILYFERLLDILRKAPDGNSVRIIASLEKLANSYERTQRVQDSIRCLREIITIEDGKDDTPPAAMAVRYDKLSAYLEQSGQMAEAVHWQNQSREIKGQLEVPKPAVEPKKAGEPAPLQRKVFIGHLLTRSGLVKFEDLNTSIQCAKKLDLPVGQVLISAGLLSEEHLEAALHLQQQVKSNTLSFDAAANALNAMLEKGITVEQALGSDDGKHSEEDTKLGSLLIDAGIITADQLKDVLKRCSETGTPLGKQLVLSRTASALHVSKALECQELIRLNTMTVNDALTCLRQLNR